MTARGATAPTASAAPAPSRAAPIRLYDRTRLGDDVAPERPIRKPAILHAETRRDVTDGVERLIVGDDVDHVPRPRTREPDAGGDGDPQIAPVAYAGRWRAVDEVRAVRCEETGRFVSDHAPIADRREVGVDPHPIDHQVVQHVFDVLRTTRVLDVEEDAAPLLGTRPRRRRGTDARRERGLGYDGHHRGEGNCARRRLGEGLLGRDLRWGCRPLRSSGLDLSGRGLLAIRGRRPLLCCHAAAIARPFRHRTGR